MRLKAAASSKWLKAWPSALAVSLLIWGLIAWDLARLYEHSFSDAKRQLENMVDLYAEEVASSINSIDYLLLDFRDHWNGDTKEFEALVQRRRTYVDPEMGYSASIINQRGQLIVTTVAVAKLPVDMRDRETFQYHLHNPADVIYVGKPIPMRVKDQWRIPISRPLFNKDGSFNGLVGVTVLPDYFSRFHKRVELGKDGVIALVRTDGSMLARYPNPQLALGGAIQRVFWQPGTAAPQKGFFQKQSQVDQVERLFAWRTLDRGNLAVVMGRSTADILASYHHQRTVYSAVGIAATVLLLFVAYWWGRYQHHRTQADADMRKLEEALAHSQKLESLGKLTGGVTHDFNHILQIIISNLHLIEAAAPGSPEIKLHLKSISAATEQGSMLAAQLLTFARRQPLRPTIVDVASLMRRVDGLIQRLVGPDIDVQTSIAENLWHSKVDAGLLENVILNLAANARDAMDGHGTLRISASNRKIGQQLVLPYSELAPGEYVLIAISDTGHGMTPEVMEHMFEPFFTTKPEGKGTGLGLSMAYGFIKESGGHIHLDSQPGTGTTVQLMLPRTLEELPVPLPQPVAEATGGTETILVVEDKAELRNMLETMLDHLGYQVLKAANGQEALTALQAGKGIDVLFTDVLMPGGMNGFDLARRAKALYPDLAVILTSGYESMDESREGWSDLMDAEFLHKPYNIADVNAAIRKILKEKSENMTCA